MQCPNPSCKICAANGEKTCWDLKREELLQKGDLEGLDDLDDRCAGEYIFMTDAAKRKCGIK